MDFPKWKREVFSLLKQSKKISAIKSVREYRKSTGGDWGLKSCKDYVDEMQAEFNLYYHG